MNEISLKSPGTSLASDMAFGGACAALFMMSNSLIPIYGGLAVATTVPLLNRMRQPVVPLAHVNEAVEAVCIAHTLNDANWDSWLPWDRLCAGEHVEVPVELSLDDVGFEKTWLAKSCGQVEDWVKRLPDGSRLHAHEFSDGRIEIHRDALDPSQGPATATMHWLSETSEGTVFGIAAVVGAVFLAWRLADA